MFKFSLVGSKVFLVATSEKFVGKSHVLKVSGVSLLTL